MQNLTGEIGMHHCLFIPQNILDVGPRVPLIEVLMITNCGAIHSWKRSWSGRGNHGVRRKHERDHWCVPTSGEVLMESQCVFHGVRCVV